jgi:predicted O-methyltransferase YrrM
MKIIQYLTERLVERSPETALNLLRSKHGELWIARALNKPDGSRWTDLEVPPQLAGFEDLSFLFWSSPLNRRFIRLDFDEAAALYKVVKSIPNAQGIEIGRFNGGSTVLLASAVGPNGSLLSIDSAPQDDRALEVFLKQANLFEGIELVVADAGAFEHDDQVDFVFIDGDHSYEGAKRDHNKWGSKVRPGGFIIHHDMGKARPLASQWESLATLKSEILDTQPEVLAVAREAGSMIIFRRRSSPWKPV